MKQLFTFLIFVFFSSSVIAQNIGIGTNAPTDQLHTTANVRFEGYRGPGTRLMQMDSSGRLLVTGAGVVANASPNTLIPDNGCNSAVQVVSTINITGMPTAVASSKISVRVNINHSYDGDVVVFLVAPNNAVIRLIENNGGSSINFSNTVFTDDAPTFIGLTGSLTGFNVTYKPKGGISASCLTTATVSTFSAIGGGSIVPNGNWTLRVSDNSAGSTGTFLNWQISFSGAESFNTADSKNYVPYFTAGGNFARSSFYQSGNAIGLNTITPLSTLHITDQTENLLLLHNANALNTGINSFIGFKAGNYNTARIGTTGTGTQDASLGFYTGSDPSVGNLVKRLSILDGGNIGIGLPDASISERLHLDGGNMKIGSAVWSSAADDRLLKFGDANYVSIGEAGGDDHMQLTAGQFNFTRIGTPAFVGINNPSPAYNLDVTGTLHTTGTLSAATISCAGNETVSGTLSASGVIAGAGGLTVTGGSPAANKVLTATNNGGNTTWQTPPYLNSFFDAEFPTTLDLRDNVDTLLPFTISVNDGAGISFNNTSHTATILTTGVYHFDAQVDFFSQFYNSPSGDNYVYLDLYKNGTKIKSVYVNSGNSTHASSSLILAINAKFSAGDVLSLHVFSDQNFGGTFTNIYIGNAQWTGYRLY